MQAQVFGESVDLEGESVMLGEDEVDFDEETDVFEDPELMGFPLLSFLAARRAIRKARKRRRRRRRKRKSMSPRQRRS